LPTEERIESIAFRSQVVVEALRALAFRGELGLQLLCRKPWISAILRTVSDITE
jgi:hypothetical protein